MWKFFIGQVIQVVINGEYLRGTILRHKLDGTQSQVYEVSLDAPFSDLGPRWFNMSDIAGKDYCFYCHGYGFVDAYENGKNIQCYCNACQVGLNLLRESVSK